MLNYTCYDGASILGYIYTIKYKCMFIYVFMCLVVPKYLENQQTYRNEIKTKDI